MLTLVTGATGFIGRRLIAEISPQERACRLLSRTPIDGPYECVVGTLSDKAALVRACANVASVFHCAGYAHAHSANATNLHWQVNFQGTKNLIAAAGEAGVQRFVLLSSVKAMGDPGTACIDEKFSAPPTTTYGMAKRKAEEIVLEAGNKYDMHVVNLRLSLVYGAGGRGNLEKMGQLVRRGMFPPLPETGNKRSLVHVDDVVAAMQRVEQDFRASGRTYIVTSSEAPSGRQIYDAMRTVLGMPQVHWSVPELCLRLTGRCADIGTHLLPGPLPLNSQAINRLLDSAWYSAEKLESELGWRSRVSLLKGLAEMFSGGNECYPYYK